MQTQLIKNGLITPLLVLVFLTACSASVDYDKNEGSTNAQTPAVITVTMQATAGHETAGQITFTEIDGKVMMQAKITGLNSNGETGRQHAIHLHEIADCSASDGTSAGGHWNPDGKPHGHWGSDSGFHKGDIGNLQADANGIAEISKTTDQWCIGCDDANKNIIGRAVIVHAGIDDFTTQPTGAAGARMACGEIL